MASRYIFSFTSASISKLYIFAWRRLILLSVQNQKDEYCLSRVFINSFKFFVSWVASFLTASIIFLLLSLTVFFISPHLSSWFNSFCLSTFLAYSICVTAIKIERVLLAQNPIVLGLEAISFPNFLAIQTNFWAMPPKWGRTFMQPKSGKTGIVFYVFEKGYKKIKFWWKVALGCIYLIDRIGWSKGDFVILIGS